FERLGGNETIQVDVRVVAATNQNLEDAVAAGRFRQDLFYRLNGFTLRLPPPRGRRGDLPGLVDPLIPRCHPGPDRRIRSLSDEALQLLCAYDWPGNVRELQSAIRYALVQATSDVLTPECLPETVRGGRSRPRPAASADGADLRRLVEDLLACG